MEARSHLQTAADLLRKRDFALSRFSALQAMQSDPRIHGAELIIAICDVFLASATKPSPNWYSILKLENFTDDSDLIDQQYRSLCSLLSPGKNTYSYAFDAYKMVRDAFRVLNCGASKKIYDEELRLKMERIEEKEEEVIMEEVREEEVRKEGVREEKVRKVESFWTLCPYCYCVFEYERKYVKLCLRCQNCRRGFCGVEIQWPPPLGVGEDQRCYFVGFMPFGIQGYKEGVKGGVFEEKGNSVGGGGGADVVDISDDDDDVIECDVPRRTMWRGSGAGVRNNEGKGADEAEEGLRRGVGSVRGRGGRKKTMARKSTKGRFGVMRSISDSQEDIVGEGSEGSSSSSSGSADGGEGSSNRRTGGGGGGGVDFVETGDDLMVCLKNL